VTGAWVLCDCLGLLTELEAVPAQWEVLHHGAGVTGRVLGVFSLGTYPPLATYVVNNKI